VIQKLIDPCQKNGPLQDKALAMPAKNVEKSVFQIACTKGAAEPFRIAIFARLTIRIS
jgi:hypothetical protein